MVHFPFESLVLWLRWDWTSHLDPYNSIPILGPLRDLCVLFMTDDLQTRGVSDSWPYVLYSYLFYGSTIMISFWSYLSIHLILVLLFLISWSDLWQFPFIEILFLLGEIQQRLWFVNLFRLPICLFWAQIN